MHAVSPDHDQEGGADHYHDQPGHDDDEQGGGDDEQDEHDHEGVLCFCLGICIIILYSCLIFQVYALSLF